MTIFVLIENQNQYGFLNEEMAPPFLHFVLFIGALRIRLTAPCLFLTFTAHMYFSNSGKQLGKRKVQSQESRQKKAKERQRSLYVHQ